MLKLLLRKFIAIVMIIFAVDMLIIIGNQIPVINDIEVSILEFELTDYYLSSKKRLASFEPDTNLVIVDIEWLQRDSIGFLLEVISSLQPKVAVIDVYFSSQGNPTKDSLLLEGIKSIENTILTAKTTSNNDSCLSILSSDSLFISNSIVADGSFISKSSYEDLSYYYESSYGVGQDNVIRYFAPSNFWTCDTLNHVVLEVAKFHDTQVYFNLLSRANEVELINYTGNVNSGRFKAYEAYDLFNNNIIPSDFKNKIVLIGFLGDSTGSFKNLEGKLITPLNESLIRHTEKDMNHTEVLANTISMILDGNYMSVSDSRVVLLSNMLLIFITLLLMFFLWNKFSQKTYIIRIQSYATIVLLGAISLVLISFWAYKLDLRLAIFYMIFLPDIFQMYMKKVEPFFVKTLSRIKPIILKP